MTRFLTTMFCLLMIMRFVGVQAQGESVGYTIQQDETGLAINTYNNSGNVQATIQIPNMGFYPQIIGNDVMLPPPDNNEWVLFTQTNFVLSPNHRYMAFPAHQRDFTLGLFVVDLVDSTMTHVTVGRSRLTNADAKAIWSGDSSKLLLYSGQPDAAVYLHEIGTSTLNKIYDGIVIGQPIWLPNNTQFIFNGIVSGCTVATCSIRGEVYLGDIESGIVRNISNVNAIDISDTPTGQGVAEPMFVGDIVWNSETNRVYFEVSTPLYGDPDGTIWLYSTDLAGNQRFEADIGNYYDAISDYNNHAITELDAIAFTLEHHKILFWASNLYTDVIYIFGVTSDGSVELVHEYTPQETISFGVMDAQISPDGEMVAVAMDSGEDGRRIDILSLADFSLQMTQPSDQLVCDVNWLDTSTIVYTQSSSWNCPQINPDGDISVRQLNIQTGEDQLVFEENGSFVGWVSIPSVPQSLSVSCAITVSTPPDLISAINTANGTPEAETICLDAGMYTFTAADNTLYGDNALPVITDSMTIHGLGDGATLTRDSADLFRFFYVDAGTEVTFENLTLSNGDIGTSVHGGAIYTKGNTTLRNVTLSGNNAKRGGGIRMNGAILTLEDTLFEGNTGNAVYAASSDDE